MEVDSLRMSVKVRNWSSSGGRSMAGLATEFSVSL